MNTWLILKLEGHNFMLVFFVKAKRTGEGEMHVGARRPSIYAFFYFFL
jgi:hypothetical protein